jgi:hypothetical protein
VGYRLNLLSAFSGALTVLLLDRILRRWNVGVWAALGALGLVATAMHFWALSLIAEVYTLHTALMAGLILLLLRWADQPTPGRLALVGLVAGLGLSHHLAMALLLPGCAWYVLTVAPRSALAARSLTMVLGGFLLGVSLYLYLPWRQGALPAFNYTGAYDSAGVFHQVNLRTPAGLWWLITGRAFSGQMLAYGGAALLNETLDYGTLLWRAFFGIGIGPGLLGSVLLMRRDWRLGGMLFAMFASSAVFYIDYRVIDKETMFLPTYVIWALWLGVGYQWLLDWVRERAWGTRLLRVAMAGTVLLALSWNWSLVDLSRDWSARDRGEAMLAQTEPDALIFGWWDTAPVIQYLQLVEGQRPDVRAVNRFLVPNEALKVWIEREVTRRPVYIDSLPADIQLTLKAEAVGELYRLRPRTEP